MSGGALNSTHSSVFDLEIISRCRRQILRETLCYFAVMYCPKLTVPDNGELSTCDVVYDTLVLVSCNVGFKMFDDQLSKSLICLDGSVWNDTVFHCQGTTDFHRY